jgi:hypothetical protein
METVATAAWLRYCHYQNKKQATLINSKQKAMLSLFFLSLKYLNRLLDASNT